MKVQVGIDEIKKLQNVISQNSPSFEFNIDEVVIRDEFKGWYKDHVPSKEASQKSGIYLFSDNTGEILYIGKAGADNLSAEIWGKFGAPKLNEKTKQPEFIKSKMAQYSPNNHLREKLKKGDVCIAVAVISPKELVSLIEVYLQTLCFCGSLS